MRVRGRGAPCLYQARPVRGPPHRGRPVPRGGPRNPTRLFVHQHNDERGRMSPDGGGALARACARKMPLGGTAADGQPRISHRRGRASTPSSQEPPTGARGGALDSGDHAGHRVCCGRGRNRGARAQMMTGCARTGAQCLKANFLRGCDGQGRPRPQGRPGQGPGRRPSSREPDERCVGQGGCSASTPWTGAARRPQGRSPGAGGSQAPSPCGPRRPCAAPSQ